MTRRDIAIQLSAILGMALFAGYLSNLLPGLFLIPALAFYAIRPILYLRK